MEHIINNTNGSGIFIQIGAGAGDLDSRSNYQDGFAKLIKGLPKERVKKIILVEPNPINIPFLLKAYENYDNVYIYEIAIIPKNQPQEFFDFYLCEEDGPHYQVASLNKQHIIKHYGENAKIQTISVKTCSLENFLYTSCKDENIELLSLDIEGLDKEILCDVDLKYVNSQFISFEYIHINSVDLQMIHNKLNLFNYNHIGIGVDVNGYDLLYKK